MQPPSADAPIQNLEARSAAFERSKSIAITFAPRTTTVIELKLKTKGTPYWSRPDLGIDPEDVKVDGSQMTVTVHSVGSVDAPASKVVLRDKAGKTLATAECPCAQSSSRPHAEDCSGHARRSCQHRSERRHRHRRMRRRHPRDHADEQQRHVVSDVPEYRTCFLSRSPVRRIFIS